MGYWQKEKDKHFIKGASLFEGEFDWREMSDDDLRRMRDEHPVVNAFLKDSNLLELSISSACIGFTYTIQKRPNK